MMFDPEAGSAHGAKATCPHCAHTFTVLDAVAATGARPRFRLYGKLVLTSGDKKEYLPATEDDQAAYRACSAATGLPERSIDLVVTDPPFFDNVHYSELADFFYAWQQLGPTTGPGPIVTTRNPSEVQDSDADRFAIKLQGVFRECGRILKDEGLLVFTYHHSREEGWKALADAVFGAGFVVVNSQPVKAEMSVATPKSQAKQPIQLDIILVCRKGTRTQQSERRSVQEALESAKAKLRRLREAGLCLSLNDRKIVHFGQLLATLGSSQEVMQFVLDPEIEREGKTENPRVGAQNQLLMFD
jgi:putative DNA methylase